MREMKRRIWAVLCAVGMAIAFMGSYGRTLPVHAAQENDSVSLAHMQELTVNEAGKTIRVYGNTGEKYAVPINILANCTVILDNLTNTADVTVAEGVTVKIVLRGQNTIGNIGATGGRKTVLTIEGERGTDTLTTGTVAWAEGGGGKDTPIPGEAKTGAVVNISNCVISCTSIGCGGDGDAWYYVPAGYVYGTSYATQGGCASPVVNIVNATVNVAGNIACGGSGALKIWSLGHSTSPGGTSGQVVIRNSRVTAGGSMAIGGAGGEGKIDNYYHNITAGKTQSSSAVTITENSVVKVTGDVGTQPDLPEVSFSSTERGLDGVTVTVKDSSLTCRDIAGGGKGHETIQMTNSGGYVFYTGTDGGEGGKLVAENAVIVCNSACNGGQAGDYYLYNGSESREEHPVDGAGGTIWEKNSDITVTGTACMKASRWDGEEGTESAYGNSHFYGGTLRTGKFYGDVITADVVSLIGSSFVCATEVRNSEEATLSKCVLSTAALMAGKEVEFCANALYGRVKLDGTGKLTTYLAIGKNSVTLKGEKTYAGVFMVKRDASQNGKSLKLLGVIRVSGDDVKIFANGYAAEGETWNYSGSYEIIGAAPSGKITVESGVQELRMTEVSLGELYVKNGSSVKLVLNGKNSIGNIRVEDGAKLTVVGTGSLDVENLEGEEHEMGDKIALESPNVYFKVSFHPGVAGDVMFFDNGVRENFSIEREKGFSRMMTAGMHSIRMDFGEISYRGEINVSGSRAVGIQDLRIYVDGSTGGIVIGEDGVVIGENAYPAMDAIHVFQSGETHAIAINKKDAVLILDNVAANTPVEVCDEFCGTIVNAEGVPMRIVVIETGFAEKELELVINGESYCVTSDENGVVRMILPQGIYTIDIVADEVRYTGKGEIEITETECVISKETFENPAEQGADDEEDAGSSEDNNGDECDPETGAGDGENTGDAENDGGNENTDNTEDTGSRDESEGAPSGSGSEENSNSGENNMQEESEDKEGSGSIGAGAGTGGSGSIGIGAGTEGNGSIGIGAGTGGNGSIGIGAGMGGNGSIEIGAGTEGSGSVGAGAGTGNIGTGGSAGGIATEPDGNTENGEGTTISKNTGNKPELVMSSNLKGLGLVRVNKVTAYKIYSAKTVRLTLKKDENCKYYYKVVPKGTRASVVKWKELKGNVIKITASNKGRRVYLKCVNQEGVSIVKKTKGFYVDAKKPVVKGVAVKRTYTSARTIRFEDNLAVRTATLNGKTVKSGRKISRAGKYKLVVTDMAGNQRIVVFYIKKRGK